MMYISPLQRPMPAAVCCLGTHPMTQSVHDLPLVSCSLQRDCNWHNNVPTSCLIHLIYAKKHYPASCPDRS